MASRVPFYYGWVVVGVAFLTLAVGVNSRTAFSLFYPEILSEFGWERGITAGVFSAGFIASMLVTPFVGVMVERWGPQIVIPLGAVLVSSGLALTTLVTGVVGLYLTMGAMVVGGSVFVSYIGHSAFLPNWFVKRRGLMLGVAFSGVGVGGVVLFPVLQTYIAAVGWREACLGLALLVLITIVPLNFFLQRGRPELLGLEPDGAVSSSASSRADDAQTAVLDPVWARRHWTAKTIATTPRVWFVCLSYGCSLYTSYAVLIHQTKYFLDVGFSAQQAAFALGLAGFIGIAGQLGVGHLSDRIGREWGWTLSCIGYIIAFALLIGLSYAPSLWLMYGAMVAVGLLGAGLAPLFSAVAVEMFQGKYFGRMYGLLGLTTAVGAAGGTWLTGALFDWTGSYVPAYLLGMVLSLCSICGIWLAGPGRIRAVAGRVGSPKRSPRELSTKVRLKALIGHQAEPLVGADAEALREERERAGAVRIGSVGIAPTPIAVPIGGTRRVHAFALDTHGRRMIMENMDFDWRIAGTGLRIQVTNDVAALSADHGFVEGTVQVIATVDGYRAVARRPVRLHDSGADG
ncbi:MAG: MFS transporter [Gammaproteobacteria bacterium]|nr:MFS transporter [Gammaproteobacteria bacterium]